MIPRAHRAAAIGLPSCRLAVSWPAAGGGWAYGGLARNDARAQDATLLRGDQDTMDAGRATVIYKVRWHARATEG